MSESERIMEEANALCAGLIVGGIFVYFAPTYLPFLILGSMIIWGGVRWKTWSLDSDSDRVNDS